MTQYERPLLTWGEQTHEEWLSFIYHLIAVRMDEIDPTETTVLDDGNIVNRREALCNFLLNQINLEITKWMNEF